ncbi:hypothetical protein [Belliella filtrata]|nr:hypothetical protein [Belliella filtrata]
MARLLAAGRNYTKASFRPNKSKTYLTKGRSTLKNHKESPVE